MVQTPILSERTRDVRVTAHGHSYNYYSVDEFLIAALLNCQWRANNAMRFASTSAQ